MPTPNNENNNNSVFKLYNLLQNDNYDVPEYDEFKNQIANEENRRNLYDVMADDNYDMPDFDTFSSRLGFGVDKEQQQQTATALQGLGTAIQDAYDAQAPTKEEQQVTQQQQTVTEQRGEQPETPEAPEAQNVSQQAQKPQLSEQEQRNINNIVANAQRETDIANAVVNEVGERLQNLNKRPLVGNAKPNYFNGNNISASGKVLPTTTKVKNGKLTTEYILPDGSTTENKVLADAAETQHNIIFSQPKSVDKQIDQMQKSAQESKEERREALNEEYSYLRSGALFNARAAKIRTDKDMQIYNMIDEGSDRLKELLKQVKREDNEGFVHGVLRGIEASVADKNTWMFGVQDAQKNQYVYDAIKKWFNGEELSDSEQRLLDFVAMEAVTLSETQEKLGRGYKAGQVTGESLPFMLEMFFNPAAGIGKGIARKFSSWALKKFGTNTLSRAGRFALGTAKIGTRAVGDIIGGTAMNATTGIGMVSSNALERQIGEITPRLDVAGNVKFAGQKGMVEAGTAIQKAFVSQMLERWSEMVGEYFEPVTGAISGAFMKQLEKKGLKGLTDMFHSFRGTDFYKKFKNFQERTRWNGLTEEYMEEVVNNMADAALVGDQTFDTNADTGVFNLSNNIDTFLGVSLMGGFFSTINTVGMGAHYIGNKYSTDKKLESLDRQGQKYWGEGKVDEWSDFITAVGDGDLENTRKELIKIATSKNLTNSQKEIAFRYASLAAQRQGSVEADDVIVNQHLINETEKGLNESFNMGYNLADAQSITDAGNLYKAATERVSKIFDEETLQALQENPIETLAKMQAQVENGQGLSAQDYNTALDYVYAMQMYNGARSSADDDANNAIEENNAQIDSITKLDDKGQSTGQIEKVALKEGGEYYVVQGNIAINDDGTVNEGESSSMIIVTDAESGNTFAISASDISKVDAPQNAQEMKEQQAEEIQSAANQAFEDMANGKVWFVQGDTYNGIDEQGNRQRITILGDATDEQGNPIEGSVVARVGNSEPVVMNKEDIQAMIDRYNIARITPQEEEKQPQEENAQPQDESQTQLTQLLTSLGESVAVGSTQGVSNILQLIDGLVGRDSLTLTDKQQTQLEAARQWLQDQQTQTPITYKKGDRYTVKIGDNETEVEVTNVDEDGDVSFTTSTAQTIEGDRYWDDDNPHVSHVLSSDDFAKLVNKKEETPTEAIQPQEPAPEKPKEEETPKPTEENLLKGVPDYTIDTEKDARQRGYRNQNGHIVRRQEPVTNKVEGKDITVTFTDTGVKEKGKLVLMDVSQLQSSHHLTQRNLAHFLNDAQPKLATAKQIADRANRTQQHAQAIEPNNVVSTPETSTSAYRGAPVVNARGEAIQGNGRADVLRLMYNEHPEEAEKYKQHLRENANAYGLTPEDVDKMKNPVLVRMLDVDDDRAVALGQYTASDEESGGKESINAKTTATKLGNKVGAFAKILLEPHQHATGEDFSLDELISANGLKALKYLGGANPEHTHYISQTQISSAIDERNNITPEGKRALKEVLFQSLFGDVSEEVERTFYGTNFPDKARKALLATLYRDFNSPEAERIIPYVVEALKAYTILAGLSNFNSSKTIKDVMGAINEAKNQLSMETGEPLLVGFSNFATDLAGMFKALKQKELQNILNNIFDLVQGVVQTDMFSEGTAQKSYTLLEAADKVLNDAEIRKSTTKTKNNGEAGSTTVAGSNEQGEQGRQGEQGTPTSTKRNSQDTEPTNNTGGAANVGERAEEGANEKDKEIEKKPSSEENQQKEEKKEEKVGEEKEKSVSSQGEDLNGELTVEEIDNSDLAPELKTLAKDYLNGKRDEITTSVYQYAKEYVRNTSRNGAGDSTNANGTHVGSGTNEAERVESGRSGELGVRVGEAGVAETMQGSERRGTVSDNDSMAEPTGREGDRGVSGGESVVSDNEPNPTVQPRTSSKRSSNGRAVSNTREGQEGRNKVSTTNAGGENQTRRGEDIADRLIEEGLNELKNIFKHPLGGQSNDKLYSTILPVGGLAVNIIRAIPQLIKVGAGIAMKGYYKLLDWKNRMTKAFYVPLKEEGMSDEEIDRFIIGLWNSNLEINGVEKTIAEWAKEKELEAIRKQLKTSVEERVKKQKEAEGVKVVVGDLANIRESLPMLLLTQQEDVLKAETQYFDNSHADKEHGYGKGYLFTNGTGTGKTYTGLGIIKRFVKQGKGRVLIVTTSDANIDNWVRSAENLGIDVTKLKNKKEKGKNVVVTQYANMRDNYELLKDEFDLIVYDESHKIIENQEGSITAAAAFHYMLSNRDVEQALLRVLQTHPTWVRDRKVDEEIKNLLDLLRDYDEQQTLELQHRIEELGGINGINDRIAQLTNERENLREEKKKILAEAKEDPQMRKAAEDAVAKTKVLFLSATPFNTALNLDYVEGYIFSYPDVEGITEHGKLRDNFIMNTFGSSHGRNAQGKVSRLDEKKITDPDKVAEEEVAFSNYLQNTLNTMSGRMLDSVWDYSREFPKIDFPEARVFNKAVSELTNGKYKLIKKYFSKLFHYTTQTALFEIIKTDYAIERAKEHLKQGRKVVIFHRRKGTTQDIINPFESGLQAVRMTAQTEAEITLAKEFAKEFAELLQWERNLDYSFPQEKIMEAFSTPEEKEAYREALKKWQLSGQKGTEPTIKSARVGAINGKEAPSARTKAIKEFNKDDSKMDVIVVQIASGKEGISLHDTTGKHQRAQICIALPESPIEFIQTEGRIYRIGNESNAIFEYPLLGLDIELSSFASKINGRSQTTENLALGDMARGLRDSIARAALASRTIPVTDNMGTGGKALDDAVLQNATGYDNAISNYSEWANNAPEEGIDFSHRDVPDPIGYKMTEWGAPESGETVFIPDAGIGTVARYVSGKCKLHATEGESAKFAKLITLVGGMGRKIENKPISEINPSYTKADVCICRLGQLNECLGIAENSGRIILLVKESEIDSVNNRISNAKKAGYYTNQVAEIILPATAMQSDGERTHIFVYNVKKGTNTNFADTGSPQITDLSDISDNEKLFEELRNVNVPKRDINKVEKVRKRVKKYEGKLGKIPFVAQEKREDEQGKQVSKPIIRNTETRLNVLFKKSTIAPLYISSKDDVEKWRFRNFEIYYDAIAANRTQYIVNLAKAWVMYNNYANGLAPIGDVCYDSVLNENQLAAVRDTCRLFRDIIADALGKNEMQIRNIADGISENRITGVLTMDKFKQAFDALNQGNAELSDLAERVFLVASRIDGMEIKVVSSTQMPSANGVGAYVVQNGKSFLLINGDEFNSIKVPDDYKAHTIIHELIHAVTVYYLENYRNGNTGWMSEEQKEACREIADVYKAIQSDDFRVILRSNSRAEDNAEYGLNSEDEMVAELASPAFRAALRAKNVWRQIINGTKKILSIDVTNEENTQTNTLDVLNHALNVLMDGYNGEEYKNFEGRYFLGRNLELPSKEDVVADISDELHLSNVEVINDVNDVPERARGKKGYYNTRTGKITIIAPNNHSLEDVEKTILHEATTHYGLRQLLGEHFNGFLDDVFSGVDEATRAEIVDKARENGWDFRRATEEYLGDMSDSMDWQEKPSLWAKIKYLFSRMLTRCGFKHLVRIDDNDLRYMLWRSRENLRNPNRGIIETAEDIAKQQELQVGDFDNDELLYRDDDTPTARQQRAEIRDSYERKVKSGAYQTYEAMLDHMASLKEVMESLTKGKYKHVENVPDAMNAYLGENRLSSVNDAETDAMKRLLFDPMYRAARKIAKTRNARRELMDYMMAKHGLERNEFMARRDAEKEYEDYKKLEPDGTRTLDEFIEKYRKKDYSGLTNIFGVDDVAEAEEMAQDFVDKYEEAHNTAELWERINAVNDAILSKSLECGMMSRETYDYIKSMYDFYIPLRGFDETISSDEYAYLPDRQNVYNSVQRAAKGRKSKADDPFANMESMAMTTIVEGNRNKLVKQPFYNFTRKYPSDLISTSPIWIEHDDKTDTWQLALPDDINEDDSPEEVAEKMRAFNEKMKQLAEEEPDKYKKGKEAARIPYRVVTNAEKHQHQVIVKIDGEDYIMTVNGNPRLAMALNGKTNPDNQSTGSMGAIIGLAGRANRGISAIYTTLQPDFIASNYIRDMIYSNTMTWVRENPKYAATFNANCVRFNPLTMFVLLDKYRRDTLNMDSKAQRQFYEFMTNGGETGYVRMMDIEDIKKMVEKKFKGVLANDLVRVLGELGRGVEMCARFSAFVTSRDLGRDIGRSIWDAKEVSVNFNKKGAGDKFLSKKGQTKVGDVASFASGMGRLTTIFWNASLQGTFNNFFKYGIRHPAKFISVMALFGIWGLMKGMMGAGGGGDDRKKEEDDGNMSNDNKEYTPDYYDLPAYTRRTNIVTRGKDNTWLKFPLPIEYRPVYGMGELLGSALAQKEEITPDAIASLIGELSPIDFEAGQKEGDYSLVRPLTPSLAQPMVDINRNVSFSGVPIYKDTPYNKDLPEWMKAYSFTNPALVKASAWLNEVSGGDNVVGEKGKIDINPASLEYALRSYMPFYTLANQLTNLVYDVKGEKEFNWRDVPLLNRVIASGDETIHYKRVNNRYYELKDEYEKTKSKLKKYDKQVNKGLLEYAEKIDFIMNSDAYKRYQIFDEYQKQINRYDKRMKAAQEPEEKQFWQDSLNITKQQLVNEVDALKKKQ